MMLQWRFCHAIFWAQCVGKKKAAKCGLGLKWEAHCIRWKAWGNFWLDGFLLGRKTFRMANKNQESTGAASWLGLFLNLRSYICLMVGMVGCWKCQEIRNWSSLVQWFARDQSGYESPTIFGGWVGASCWIAHCAPATLLQTMWTTRKNEWLVDYHS